MLKALSNHAVQFSEISRFPDVKRDLALLIDSAVRFEDIEASGIQHRKEIAEVGLFVRRL